MNKLFFGLMAVSALMFSSCSEDNPVDEAINDATSGEVVDTPSTPTVTFSATIEGDDDVSTRTTVEVVSGTGTVRWAGGDVISIANSAHAFETFTLTEGAGTVNGVFKGTFTDGTTAGDIAVYPAGAHSYDGTTLTVNLPDTYGNPNEPYTPNANVPMYAEITEDRLYFKHLGALVYFTATVPAGTSCVVLTAKGIAGNFPVDMNEETPVITQASDIKECAVSHRFKAFETETTETFYFPVPVGSYQKFTVTFTDADGGIATKTLNFSDARTLARTTIAKMPTLSGLTLDAGYVDLGLPSGTLWAKANVGAVNDYDNGYLFAWGETKAKTVYKWNSYVFSHEYNEQNKLAYLLTKYVSKNQAGQYGYDKLYDDKHNLELCDDAAYIHLGNNWKMPTYEQITELIDHTVSEWTDNYNANGVSGYVFKGKDAYADKSIFLPAAGLNDGDNNGYIRNGVRGYYWSNYTHVGHYQSNCLRFTKADTPFSETSTAHLQTNVGARYIGMSVRPVCEPEAE